MIDGSDDNTPERFIGNYDKISEINNRIVNKRQDNGFVRRVDNTDSVDNAEKKGEDTEKYGMSNGTGVDGGISATEKGMSEGNNNIEGEIAGIPEEVLKFFKDEGIPEWLKNNPHLFTEKDPNRKRRLKRLKKGRHKNRVSRLEIPLYATLWFFWFWFSWVIPLYLGFCYLNEIFGPYLLKVRPFTGTLSYDSLKEWVYALPTESRNFFEAVSNPVGFLVLITAPGVLLGLYLLKLFISATVMKFYYWSLNKIWQRMELVKVQPIGITSDDVNIYHTRNFLLRIIKWEFTKGPFPWLANWMFNYIGSNKIGKNAVVEDSYYCQEFLEMGDNSYIGQMSIVSSHLVEGQYGALTIKKVKLGKSAVIGAFNLIPPGVELGDNTQILPMSATLKFQHLKPNSTYWGLPIQRLTKSRYKKLIKLPKELFQSKSESDKGKNAENPKKE